MGSPPHFTELSARSDYAAALATGGILHTHTPPGRVVRLPDVRQHTQGGRSVVDIAAEPNAAPTLDAERDESQLHGKCCCKLQPETSVS